MSISELIRHVGDENIRVQSLSQSFTKAHYSAKKNCTSITFNTSEDFGPHADHMALVVWIPKNKIPPQTP